MNDKYKIEKLSYLSRLSLTESEQKQAESELDKLLDMLALLQQADTQGVEELSRVPQNCNRFREDVVTEGLYYNESSHFVECIHSDELLQNAPEQQNGMFVVPETLE